MSAANDFGRVVWAPDADEGYVLGTLVDIGAEKVTVERNDNKELINAPYEDVYPTEEDLSKTVEDNCALMYLNEATLLHNCHDRYKEKKIYSYVANILISINPYEDIENVYSEETIEKYRGKSLGQLPPHIYAIADKAYRDMRRTKESQSIVVSGESGAGKTESQKAVLKYLCHNWGASAGVIQQRILETNPILEAFGNAKTMRNNNSSRFGKFVEIHFGAEGNVAGGFVSHYLLEKSRICKQSEGERTYHIFYQLISGLDDASFNALRLAPAAKFNYLRHGNTCLFGNASDIPAERVSDNNIVQDAVVDDRRDFVRLKAALEGAGLAPEQIRSIWSTVAAVLHLGNISFVENVADNRGGCCVDPVSEMSLRTAAQLMGIEEDELRIGLVSRIMQATKGGVKGTLIRVPLKPHEAGAARDALAKAIYSRLFDWLVAMINKSINQSADGSVVGSRNFIGVLDIAGFEFFVANSFEQFCINYCNEKLQNFFNERILNQEQDLYEKEGLCVPRISYNDNHDCIDLFERRGSGLLDLLDEEARLPRASPQHFTLSAHDANKGHFRFETPRKSKLRSHRELRDDEGFLVRHFAGTVCYQTGQFLEKNNDQLHNSLEILIEQSSHAFLCSLFESPAPVVVPEKRLSFSKKLQSTSVGSKFRTQLIELIKKLQITGTHFVRCVKPNSTMSADKFDGQSILGQLKCAGLTAVLKLMQMGFPSRTSFSDLYSMYQDSLPAELARLDARLFCKCLFRALGLNNEDFQFGQTKVFFRAGKFAEFDQMLRQDPSEMQMLVDKVRSWLNRTRWRKIQYAAWSGIKLNKKILYRREKITLIQSAIRGYVVRKHFKPRLALYRGSLNLLARSNEMTEIVSELESDSAEKWKGPVVEASDSIQQLIDDIKGTVDEFNAEEAQEKYDALVKTVDTIIVQLKEQMENDEKEKILEVERKRQEEEERKARELAEEERLEKERAMRKAMELEREEEERKWKLKLAEQEAEEKENKRREEQLERERLDAELAARISKDDSTQKTIDTQIGKNLSELSAPSPCKVVSNVNDRNDISGWKYPELRAAINTSKDADLVAACKAEFHRRLRTYNDWKARNASPRGVAAYLPPSAPRATRPLSTFFTAPPSTATISRPPTGGPPRQRYFKVPLPPLRQANERPARGVYQQGLWYGQFDGEYVVRQMELRPNQNPVLLSAGRDDMSMYQVSLEQSGLTRRKGAEILPSEFEAVWTHLNRSPLRNYQ